MKIIGILCFLLWGYIVWVCQRAQLKFYKFVVGGVGLFIFLMIWVQPIVVQPLSIAVSYVSGLLGELTGLYDSYYKYGMLFIPKHTAAVSLYIDFECSGVIEIMAYLCLLWFFELYSLKEKIKLSILGVVAIFFANVIRIFVICVMINIGGNNIFYFAHSIFGRLVFYVLSVMLYFKVFTKGQIMRQKVGTFSYDKEEEDE